MTETVEKEATDEVRRHCELLVENGGDLAPTAAKGVILMQAGLDPRGGGEALMARQVGRRSCGAKAAVGRDELGGARRSQARRGPLIHAKIEARAARHKSNARRRTDDQLSLFPQARAYARQPTTRMQAEGRWCGSRVEATHWRCDQARRSCRRLRGCAGQVSVAHVREQKKFNP
jgi:hypothetical protein